MSFVRGQQSEAEINSRLEQLRLYLSDPDCPASPDFESEVSSSTVFLQSIRRENLAHDEGLFKDVHGLLVVRQNQLNAIQHHTPITQQLHETSTRFTESSGMSALVEDFAESKQRDCHPFTRRRDNNHADFLKSYRASENGLPNRYVLSDMRAFLEALDQPLSQFEQGLASLDDFTALARRRGRRRRLIEYALNRFASNTEQNRRGNPDYQIVDLPTPVLPAVHEPQLYAPLEQVPQELMRDPFVAVKKYIRFGQNRAILKHMVLHSKTGNSLLDENMLHGFSLAHFPSLVKHYVLKRLQRLKKFCSTLLLELPRKDLNDDRVFELTEQSAPRKTFSTVAEYFRARLDLFFSYSDDEKAQTSKQYLDDYLTHDSQTISEQSKFLNEEELRELQATSASDSAPDDRVLGICLKLVNETIALLSTRHCFDQTLSPAMYAEKNMAAESAFALLSRGIQDSDAQERGFCSVAELAQGLDEWSEEASYNDNVRALRRRLIQEHCENGPDYRLDSRRLWSFADSRSDINKDRIWFSLERTTGQVLFRAPPLDSDETESLDSAEADHKAEADEIPELGQGKLFPKEMVNFGLEEYDAVARAGLADGEVLLQSAPSVFTLGETPYQSAVASRRIARDLSSSDLLANDSRETDTLQGLQDARKPFTLPVVDRDVFENLDSFTKWGVFTVDNLHPAFSDPTNDESIYVESDSAD